MRRALALLGLLALLAQASCASAPPASEPLPVARLGARAPEARCSACTLPLAGAVRQWPDGRLVCGSCHAEAVVDPAQADALLAAARDDLRARFGVSLDEVEAVDLRLVDRPALLSHARELAHPALQAFSTVRAGEADEAPSRASAPARTGGAAAPRRVQAVTIEALYGLPRAALRGILVHELFHAHQTARRADVGAADPAFVEGAAQFVQLRVLEATGAHAWAARLLANEDPLYGRGLRRFRRLVAAEGEARALERGAAEPGFPPGF